MPMHQHDHTPWPAPSAAEPFRWRRRSVIVAAAAAAIGLALSGNATAGERPMAVWFYADWCMNCKLIAPKIATVQPEYEARVEFIKLDVTQAAGKAQSQQRARELGIWGLYMDNTATGWLALVDRKGRQVGELRQHMTLDQMRQALDRLVAAP